ncbi:AMP-binding protein, partial [Streptomyces meridianus]
MATDPSVSRLEARLRTLRDVLDCAIVPTGDGPATTPAEPVAFVVPAAQAGFAGLKRRVAVTALEAGLPVQPVLVDDVPRLPDGTVDLGALDRVPVLSEALLRRHGDAHCGAGTALALEPTPFAAGRLHLAGLDPEPPAEAPPSAGHARPASDARAGSATLHAAPATPALSRGPDPVPDPGAPRTLPEALLRTAGQRPDSGLHLVLERDRTVFLSYPELLSRAQRILGGLRAAGVAAGDRAILQVPSLDRYFPALWACLLGGIQPVTVAGPPGYDTRGAVLDKLHHAWQTLREPVVVASGASVDGVRAMTALYPMQDVSVLDVEELERAEPVTEPHLPDPGETALLQLSSGSTGHSKAIRITHRGVMEYVAGARAQGTGPGDTTVNWLPLDHVAGLLMFHLRDTVLGCPAVHTPTDLVVADPLLWLDLLERHGAAHSWSPNFGYKLVVEALRRRPDRRWDLSAVRSLINAGEQCTLPVVTDFLAATAPFGVAEDAMLLAWGMAETCTAISYKRFGSPGTVHRVRKSSLTGDLEWVGDEVAEAERTTFLSMGAPTLGARFRICDDEDRVLPEGRIGRLQVAGGRVTPGYLDNPEANAEAFRGEGWFDTGDLAFLRNGELTITGRRKEVIIINGSHYFCHELEDAVGSIDGVTAGSVAACGVPAPGTGSEQLVVFFVPAETAVAPADPVPAVRRIRAELARRFQLAGAQVVPVTAADFPKTTSGKIQRTGIRRRFLDGGFDDVLRELDLAEGNARTVPDALHRAVWEPLPGTGRTAPPVDPATTLVLADRTGLAAELTAGGGPFAAAVVVTQGDSYACIGLGRYTLDFAERTQWDALWAELRELNRTPTTLLHLAGCAEPVPLDITPGELRPVLDGAGLSLVLAVQAHRAACADGPTRVVTVSRGLHRVTGEEPVGCAGALTAAVAGALALEWAAAD